MATCPACGSSAEHLMKLGALAKKAGYSEVCPSCYSSMSAGVSRGAQLRAQMQAKEQGKAMMWKNRVSLVKNGRTLMQRKSYSEAAVQYEKYIRTIEIAHSVAPGGLRPEHLKNNKKEVYVLISALWDLVQIYDSSARYGERQQAAADKLVLFSRGTTLHRKVARNAQRQGRKAKNKFVFRKIASNLGAEKGCFIATATYQSEQAWQVLTFRAYRDKVLENFFGGRVFITCYYGLSPILAKLISANPILQRLSRLVLNPLARRLAKKIPLE
jgi:hypothetical protein